MRTKIRVEVMSASEDKLIQEERDAAVRFANYGCIDCQCEDALLIGYIKRTLPVGPKKSGKGRPRKRLTEEERIARNTTLQKLRKQRRTELEEALRAVLQSSDLLEVIAELRKYVEWLPDDTPTRYTDDGYLIPIHDGYRIPNVVKQFIALPSFPPDMLLINTAERIGLLKIETRGRSETWYTKT